MKRRDFLISGLAGAALPLSTRGAPCPPPTISLDGVAATSTCATNALADWNARISGPGVVWHHNFDSAAEVNAFRWSGGYFGGNDPRGVGNSGEAANVAWVASGGADGGGYMQLTRNSPNMDNCYWWRPFSPLTGASNGRGVNDPGANGTLTPGTLIATDGGTETLKWASSSNAKPGWYGNAAYQNSFFDGTDFYFQVRVMADPRRTTTDNIQIGKFTSFTNTNNTYTSQELVTYSGYFPKTSGVGAPNYHNVYQGYNYTPLSGVATTSSGTRIQLGSEISGVCDPYNRVNSGCWSYSFGWDTLLYHVTPGHDGVADTRYECWAAHPGETSYVKIWDVIYPAHFDSSGNTVGGIDRNGWNGLLLWIYHNGFSMSPFWQRFDQVIFSKSFIPCPQV